jgi:diguanylate cyclase (GGDEF)-like protein/PAS domain S-box-containing protein
MTGRDFHWPAALGSLKLRITAGGVAALLLGIGLITFLLVTRAEEDTLATEQRREATEVARTAALLSRQLIELQLALGAVIPELGVVALGDEAAMRQFAESQPVLRRLFTGLFVAAEDGEMRVRANSTEVGVSPRLSLADRDYFQRTLRERRSIISEPVSDRLRGEPSIVFTQPIRDATGAAGVLGGALRLSSRDLLDGLVDDDGRESAAMLVVTTQHGQVLAHPDRARLMTHLSEEPRLAQAFANWRAMGAPVEPLGIQLAQPGELVSAAGVPGPDWMIWRARAEADLLAPLRAARTDALIVAVALIALMSVAFLALLWRLLRPLTLLEHRAQHLFDGTLAPHVGWPAAAGEIGSLSRVLRRVGLERVQLEATNAETMRKLGSVMSAAPVGIAFVRGERFELVSAEFCRLFASTQHDLIDQPVRMLFASDEDHAAFLAQERSEFRALQPYRGEWQLLRHDGTRFWAGLRTKPVDPADRTRGTIWTLSDVEDQRAARQQLEWSAAHDALTGLANRATFERQAQRLVEALPASLPAVLVFLDLDRFKPVNDTAGHLTGDLMLLTVATAITARVRTGDLVARIGGDEFALLLEHCTPEMAMRIAHDVRRAITEVVVPSPHGPLSVGASVGVAALQVDMGTVNDWLRAADAACYAAKAAGRDTVRGALLPDPAHSGP